MKKSWSQSSYFSYGFTSQVNQGQDFKQSYQDMELKPSSKIIITSYYHIITFQKYYHILIKIVSIFSSPGGLQVVGVPLYSFLQCHIQRRKLELWQVATQLRVARGFLKLTVSLIGQELHFTLKQKGRIKILIQQLKNKLGNDFKMEIFLPSPFLSFKLFPGFRACSCVQPPTFKLCGLHDHVCNPLPLNSAASMIMCATSYL